MYEFDLLVYGERLLCEIGEEAKLVNNAHSSEGDLHLLRYLATGSALFVLKSFKKPGKLKDGSELELLVPGVTLSVEIIEDVPRAPALVAEGGRTGVANGSNSDTSACFAVGVCDEDGVDMGSSFAAGFGGGAWGGSARG
jgi:hypothetical protein